MLTAPLEETEATPHSGHSLPAMVEWVAMEGQRPSLAAMVAPGITRTGLSPAMTA